MINTTTNENLKIEIYTIRGQSVMSTECTNNISQMRIDISQLPAGMYFIRIANNQNNITKKFVKEQIINPDLQVRLIISGYLLRPSSQGVRQKEVWALALKKTKSQNPLIPKIMVQTINN